jgi:hypothetical protein
VGRRGKRLRRSDRGEEFDQSPLYVCMEISKWNSFVKLIYTNFKNEKIKVYCLIP